MREVTEQLWRAGKYAAVAIVVLASLPVLVPSVFVLSVLIFTFVLPLLCAIAGFLYLQKHATMLYRYLPGAIRRPSGADSSHIRLPPSSRSGALTLLELLRKDADSIDTFEVVDQEFDAVLVSSMPKLCEAPVLQRGEATQRSTVISTDISSDSAQLQRKNADQGGCPEESFARGELRQGGRKEGEGDDEQDFRNAEEMSVLDDKHAKSIGASGFLNGAVNLQQDNREGESVRTVPNNSGAYDLYDDNPFSKADGKNEIEHSGRIDTGFSECEKQRGVDLNAYCTKSGEGVGDVQGFGEEEKNFSNEMDSDVYEAELATLNEYSVEDITSEDSMTCAVHPNVLTTERDVSGINPGSSSGESRSESNPLDYASLQIIRPDESALDHESFESTSEASFEPPQSEKGSHFQDEEYHHSQRSQSLRGMESFDGNDDRDDLSLADESRYHYEVHSEAPERGDREGEEIAQAPETFLGRKESCSMLSNPEERISRYPSSTSHESDSSEEKAGTMRSSRSALTFSEDMYDSEEQLHLQQVHDEEERQLREELEAIKIVVGDEEASGGLLVSEIEELSQVLGIELPSMTDDIPELEWAKVAVEVMKVVIGME